MTASKLSLQAMPRLCFLCRLCQHILANSNAPFVERLVDWFLLVGCGMLLFQGCLLSHFAVVKLATWFLCL